MVKNLLNVCIKTTATVIIFLFVWNIQHIKDGYNRYIIGREVVKIIGQQGSGSGFHVKANSGKTYILTNAHVCQLADKKGNILVQRDQTLISRKVISIYKKHDLCLIDPLPNHSDTGLDVASNLSIGEDIVLIGHPSGRPLTLSKGEFVLNRIIYLIDSSVKNQTACKMKSGIWQNIFGFIEFCVVPSRANGITSPSYPGNSGSPVVNKWGNVVGVLFAGSIKELNDNYMVPLNEVQNFLKDY